jgi:hypothetical protein
MGFKDKLKSVFSKKDKGDKAAKSDAKAAPAKKGAAKDRASEFKGTGKVGDALRFAAKKIDAQVAAKKITDARGNAFMGQLKAVEASKAEDDAKLVQISQIIGGVTLKGAH